MAVIPAISLLVIRLCCIEHNGVGCGTRTIQPPIQLPAGIFSTGSKLPALPAEAQEAPLIGEGDQRMGQVGREHSGLSGPASLLQQCHPRAQGTALCPENSGLSPVRRLHTLLGSLGGAQPQERSPSSHSGGISQASVPACSPVAGHHRAELVHPLAPPFRH